MAQSINEVSASATQGAKVAEQSLNVAEKGSLAVQNQIAGMNEIALKFRKVPSASSASVKARRRSAKSWN